MPWNNPCPTIFIKIQPIQIQKAISYLDHIFGCGCAVVSTVTSKMSEPSMHMHPTLYHFCWTAPSLYGSYATTESVLFWLVTGCGNVKAEKEEDSKGFEIHHGLKQAAV
jgi:hypothetical protein